MLTKYERIQLEVERLEKESSQLKARHYHGFWSNWEAFTKIDMIINDYKIKLLQLENESLKESLEIYKDYEDVREA